MLLGLEFREENWSKLQCAISSYFRNTERSVNNSSFIKCLYQEGYRKFLKIIFKLRKYKVNTYFVME